MLRQRLKSYRVVDMLTSYLFEVEFLPLWKKWGSALTRSKAIISMPIKDRRNTTLSVWNVQELPLLNAQIPHVLQVFLVIDTKAFPNLSW